MGAGKTHPAINKASCDTSSAITLAETQGQHLYSVQQQAKQRGSSSMSIHTTTTTSRKIRDKERSRRWWNQPKDWESAFSSKPQKIANPSFSFLSYGYKTVELWNTSQPLSYQLRSNLRPWCKRWENSEIPFKQVDQNNAKQTIKQMGCQLGLGTHPASPFTLLWFPYISIKCSVNNKMESWSVSKELKEFMFNNEFVGKYYKVGDFSVGITNLQWRISAVFFTWISKEGLAIFLMAIIQKGEKI